MQCCAGNGRRKRRATLQKRLERANQPSVPAAPIAAPAAAAAPATAIPATTSSTFNAHPPQVAERQLTAQHQLVPADLLAGVPLTMPPAVACLFRRRPDAAFHPREQPEVLQREQQFYQHGAVVRASRLVERYVAREEAALLIAAAWKMIKLRHEARILTRQSLQELKHAASLDEDLQFARESLRQSERSGLEEHGATSASGSGGSETGALSAITAVFAARGSFRSGVTPRADRSLEEHFQGYLSKALLSVTEEAGRAASRHRTRSRGAQSIDLSTLDLPALEERARQKCEAAARARALAEAARNAAETARAQAMERVATARLRRELTDAPRHRGELEIR